MKQYNIYNNNEDGLGTFTDDRGTITDIFYKAAINHACLMWDFMPAYRKSLKINATNGWLDSIKSY